MRSLSTSVVIAISILAFLGCQARESNTREPSKPTWQSHKYTSKINESLEFADMDLMTASEWRTVCSALKSENYDPNVYLQSAMQGQGAGIESINFRRDFIIGVLMIAGTPEGIREYC